MAEEDLIFGKNRHMFGGIEPSNMIEFTVASSYDISLNKARVKISCKLPVDTVIEGQQLCSVAGAIIKRKEGSYPKDEFDGVTVAVIHENGEIMDTGVLLDRKYYYAAFPYTSQGVYNRSFINRAELTVKKYTYLFGYDLQLNNSNPDARVSYPKDVMNANYVPAKLISRGDFSHGSWPLEVGKYFMPRPCMLSYDGRVYEYLDPNDYTKNVNGTGSQVANTKFAGNAMMEWPKIYTHREEVNGVYKFRCADAPLGPDWECWCNYDKDNNQIDHFYTSIYFGSSIDGKLRSISGTSNFTNHTAQAEVDQAKANGDGWYTEVVADRFLIQDLLVMISKSTNTQQKFGNGIDNRDTILQPGGGIINQLGLFFGDTEKTTSSVKIFGMENWWGNLWRRTAGLINDHGTQKIKITRGTKDGSSASDYNFDGTGYLTVPGATIVGSNGGYINKTKNIPYGRVPYNASGSATTYEADGLYFDNRQNNYAYFGGAYTDTTRVGAFCVASNLTSASSPQIGAALSFKKKV